MIHLGQKARISLLPTKKVTMPTAYGNFANVISKKTGEMPLQRKNINKYTIKLVDDKQLIYILI